MWALLWFHQIGAGNTEATPLNDMKNSLGTAVVLAMSVLAASAAAQGQQQPKISKQDVQSPTRAQAPQAAPVLLDADWCKTMEVWQSRVNAKDAGAGAGGGIAGGCPLEGQCDNPDIRDLFLTGEETVFNVVRLYIQVFRDDNGNNASATESEVIAQLETLNEDLEPWRVRVQYDWRFVDDSTYRFNPNISSMKAAYAVDPHLQCNVYVTDFGGGVGTFPWDPNALSTQGGIVIGGVFIGSVYHVLTHELGHNLGLWHTHHGTDEVNQCGNCYEEVGAPDGDFTGDFCADTPPTPANFGLCADAPGTDPCSGNPWGDTIPELYMSYGSGNGISCWDRFSVQQAARMHCWIAAELSGWLACDPDFDCNDNFIPDACDITDGTSADRNGNGIPDECETLLGDLDGDGVVGTSDLVLLLGAWGVCPDCGDCPADLDGDCNVGSPDLILLLGNWS